MSVLTAALLALSSTSARAAEEKPCASSVTPGAGATKILLSGDSVTHGSRGDWTYRYFLYKQLVAAGVDVDLVGNNNWLIDPNKSTWPFCEYVDTAFDLDYTAYPGGKLADFNVSSSNTGNKPWIRYEVETRGVQVAIAVVGANDLYKGATPQQTLAQAQQYVANARLGNPDVKIVLATVPTATGANDKYAQYNTMLAAAVPQWSTPQSPIALANVMSNWGTTAYTWDQIHPNVIGEQLIAKGLTDALHALGVTPDAGVDLDPAYKVGLRKPVTNFAASLNGSAVDLSWTLPVGGSGVQVMARDTSNGVVGSWFVVKDLSWVPADFYGIGGCQQSSPCTSYKITTLQAGHSYDIDLHSEKGTAVATDLWAVKPGEDPASASLSEAAYSFTMPGTPPAPLSVPVLNAPTAGANAVALSWSAVSGATYEVRSRLAGAGTSTTVAVSATSKTIAGLDPGQSYGFQVRALRDGAASAWSDEQLATPKPAAPVLNTPAPVVGGVTVSWPAVPGADSTYNVRWRVAGSGSYTTDTVNGTSRTISGLAPGQSYGFQVQAVANGTTGDWSAEKSAAPKLETPVLSSATPGVHAATLSWSAVPGATAYRVAWRIGSGGWSFSSYAAGTTRTVSGLLPATKYEFVLQAQAGSSLSSHSAGKFAVPKANVIGQALKPTLKALAGSKVKVTWGKVPGANRYVLQYRKGTGAWKSTGYLTGTAYTTGKLTTKKKYEFRYVPYDHSVAGKVSPSSRIRTK
ncbi:fibronectin type III domain-containing protein [Marmoricola sp. OAE513]|uniref:fibronectin type III domain-containing protein n=1 Tax=Marmoricola sp. OAE513 TaxID=2817894 RepID=UPI001AE5F31F